MAKRKKSKNSKNPPLRPLESRSPAKTRHQITALIFFLLALIFLLSLFGVAGPAGELLSRLAFLLTGKVARLLPLFFILGALVLLGTKEEKTRPLALTLLLFLIASAGISGIVARDGNEIALGGWIGYGVAFPFLKAFDVWVSLLILGGLAAASCIFIWQSLEHPQTEKEPGLGNALKERVQKIFEPKFQVEELEKIHVAQTLPPKEKIIAPPPLLFSQEYQLPPLDLLESDRGQPNAGDVKTNAAIIKKTLQNFGIDVEISEVNVGPTVTQYAFKPAEGVKLSRITTRSNDLALALAAHPIRIEAPIPGKALVGVEVPNKVRSLVRVRTLMEATNFQQTPGALLLALGRDVMGSSILLDLAKMPHLMVAGATGSGKTIALNSLILSLVYRNSPDMLRLILVDPKRVEFPVYNDLPHLLTPVVVDIQRTLNILKWLIKEMERRFEALSSYKTRDIGAYHTLFAKKQEQIGQEIDMELMPYIVLVIDELADLMAARGKELEGLIVRLAQMARAVGIHLVLATQRPSVEVITGLIKANITTRVAFQVASQIDSRTILDVAGAEKLLGGGDMLFISSEFSKPRRVQGVYTSDSEVKRVANWFVRAAKSPTPSYITEEELSSTALRGFEFASVPNYFEEGDILYDQAKQVVMEAHKASASLLQRRLKIGYARAARLLDLLEERGVIGPGEGAKPREVYIGQLHELGGQEKENML